MTTVTYGDELGVISFKVKISNRKQSEQIQKHLFSIGYKWGIAKHFVQHTDFLFLVCFGNTITCTSEHFGCTELQPNEVLALDKVYG